MKLKFLLFIIITTTLLNCASSRDYINVAKSKCSKFGFKEGTDAMSYCMMQQEQEMHNRRSASSKRMACAFNSMRLNPSPGIC